MLCLLTKGVVFKPLPRLCPHRRYGPFHLRGGRSVSPQQHSAAKLKPTLHTMLLQKSWIARNREAGELVMSCLEQGLGGDALLLPVETCMQAHVTSKQYSERMCTSHSRQIDEHAMFSQVITMSHRLRDKKDLRQHHARRGFAGLAWRQWRHRPSHRR